MKNKIAITLIVAALLSLAGTVEARDSWRGHKGGHYRDHASLQHRNKHYRSHGTRHHYRSEHYYRNPYAHHRHQHHGYSSFRDGLKFAAGALIIGSVVHSINDYGSRQVAYRVSPAGLDRWYRIDQDGQCVEVRRNRYGEEVWTYTESYRCY
jgi:hypothetical protein